MALFFNFDLMTLGVNTMPLAEKLRIQEEHILELQKVLVDPMQLYKYLQQYIWVKLPWTYIFPKYCHFFCNFDTCFQALFALVLLFLLFLWVNHLCQSRENQVFDPSPQVRYLKKTSKHGRF